MAAFGSVALARLEANSHRYALRAVQIAQWPLRAVGLGTSLVADTGLKGVQQKCLCPSMPVERGSVFPTQLSANSGQEPLSGGAVVIGGEGTDQLGAGALDEADDVDRRPRSARYGRATPDRASLIVEDRCDRTVGRALRGTAQVPDLRGVRRVSLRRGCRFAWWSAR